MLNRRSDEKTLTMFFCLAACLILEAAPLASRPVFAAGNIRVESFQERDLRRKTDDGGKAGMEEAFVKAKLGAYKVSGVKNNLALNNYSSKVIDLAKSRKAKTYLETLFGAPAQAGEEYSVLYLHNLPVAFVKRDLKGDVHPAALVTDIDSKQLPLNVLVDDVKKAEADKIKAIDIILEDYKFLENRAKIAVPDRWTIDYRELKEYEDQYKVKEAQYIRELNDLQQRVSGDMNDFDTADLMESLMNAYREHAKSAPADLKSAYRIIKVGGQSFKVRATKLETPRAIIKDGDTEIKENYKWYIENITKDNKKGLNPSIYFGEYTPITIRNFRDYRGLKREMVLEVLAPDRKVIPPQGPEAEQLKTKLAALIEEYEQFQKKSGLTLAGGKGLSLSLVAGEVNEQTPWDVPPGFNVSTTAFFKFVADNKPLYNKIEGELKTLDTMDDQRRDLVTREIREMIINEVKKDENGVEYKEYDTTVPAEITKEVLVMYRQLNIMRHLGGHKTPTPVAVRSSGIKEDIKVESWLPITTGSQAGQSDTFLNIRGEKDLMEKLVADWASLFTDRAVSYRDDAIFLIFSSLMGIDKLEPKEVYYNLMDKLRHYAEVDHRPEFDAYADILSNFRDPGSVNLLNAIRDILKHEPDNRELRHCLEVLNKVRYGFIDPREIGIDVVVMQMVKSHISGVLFTVNPATQWGGVSQALYKAWYQNDKRLIFENQYGEIEGTKPCVVSFEVSYGYGENVVGGKVDPDKFVMGTHDGRTWVTLEKHKGTKLIQMIDLEESKEFFQSKIEQVRMQKIGEQMRAALAYDEVGKQINGLLVRSMFGTKYIKDLTTADGEKKLESDKSKKKRVQEAAEAIAEMLKAEKSLDEVKAYLREKFTVVADDSLQPGLKESLLDKAVTEVFDAMVESRKTSEKGYKELAKEELLGSRDNAVTFVKLIKEIWVNKKDPTIEHREEVMAGLKLEEKDMKNIAYLMRSIVDKSHTANFETADTHRSRYCITDEEATSIANMAWDITVFYRDQRDIEFAIEIDMTAPVGKRLQMHVVDKEGNILVRNKHNELVKSGDKLKTDDENKAFLRLYNVQARPYTAGVLKVDLVRKRTEVDEEFIEKHQIKPIATGTKGENATHAYVLQFESSTMTVDQCAELIKRLKRGEFTDAEREEIKKIGFNPDDYGEGKEDQLPVALYLLEADPTHDPIMRLVDAVITKRGGDTCHAAIFCREQHIPAVTATGEIKLGDDSLKTGAAITVDANNGRIYWMDPAKRIPIKFIKFTNKPYAVPTDIDGFKVPGIGRITAAEGPVQGDSPIILAVNDKGIALARTEFKGEQIGIHVAGGYGYDLLQEIKSGKAQRPARVMVDDVVSGKAKVAKKFISRVNDEIAEEFKRNPFIFEMYKGIFGRDYIAEDGLAILAGFDLKQDLLNGTLAKDALTADQKLLVRFLDSIPQGAFQLLSFEYGEFQVRYNFDYNILKKVESNPWDQKKVADKLVTEGYSAFKEYKDAAYLNFFNLLGYTIPGDKDVKVRAYDFAADKTQGMTFNKEQAPRSVNNLVGMRGTAYEIEGVDEEFEGNQKFLSFILEKVIDANDNYQNMAWFNVFVRFPRELETLDIVLGRIAEKKGKLPKKVGIMVEVPNAALKIDDFGKKLVEIKHKYAKYGVKGVFYSFGTNDLSFTAGKCDREDPRMKLSFKNPDPAALAALDEIRKNYYYNKDDKVFPLVDEGADPVIQLIEMVVKSAKSGKEPIEVSLCGEAITSLIKRGDYETGGRIMSMLDSFGISMMSVWAATSMTCLDATNVSKELTVPEAERKLLLDLATAEKINQQKGVLKGEVFFVNKAEDLIPDVVKGYKKTAQQLERKEFIKMQDLQSARSTMANFNKIVVLGRNLVAQEKSEIIAEIGEANFNRFLEDGWLKDIGKGLFIWTNLSLNEKKLKEQLKSKGFADKDEREKIFLNWKKSWDNTIEGLERRGIDWDDLQYSLAIFRDPDVNMDGWDVLDPKKSIIPSRVKIEMSGIASMAQALEDKFITIDYAAKKMYEGNLAVRQVKAEIRGLPIPDHTPVVPERTVIAEDANDVYAKLIYHPNLLLKYGAELAGGDTLEKSLSTVFSDRMGRLKDELDQIAKEQDEGLKALGLDDFFGAVSREDEVVQDFFSGLIEDVKANRGYALADDWLAVLSQRFFAKHGEEIVTLKQGMSKLLAGKAADQFIKDAFKQNMLDKLEGLAYSDTLIVHRISSLNCLKLFNMKGGFLVETVNPNPDYGIHSASRWVNDFSELMRLELAAYKEARETLRPQDRHLFALEITGLQGTQAGGIVIAWRYLLNELGLIPGESDGLLVGFNIATPADTLSVEKYFEHFKKLGSGFGFVTFDDPLHLGGAWAAVDVYWNEWRRLGRQNEVEEAANTAMLIAKGQLEKINAGNPAAQAFVGNYYTGKQSDGGLKAIADNLKLMIQAEKAVYGDFSPEFGSFMVPVSMNQRKTALVMQAETVMENASALPTLEAAVRGGAKGYIWARSEEQAQNLKKITADLVAPVIVADKFEEVLARLNKDGITAGNIALLTSDKVAQKADGAVVVNLRSSNPGEQQINSVPLAAAQAFTGVLKDDKAVVKQFAKVVNAHKNAGMITDRQAASLTDVETLQAEVMYMPLAVVSKDTADQENTYQTTVNKI